MGELVGVDKCIETVVVEPIMDVSKECIGYIRNYDNNIKQVQRLRRELENRREEIVQWVELGKMNNEEVVPEVREWLKEVDGLLVSKEEDWEELLRDEEAREKAEQCCFVHCWNPMFRRDLSKKAKEKAEEIKNKMDKMRERARETVTLPSTKPPTYGSAAAYYCGLQSREEKLEEILALLRDDKINRIGIYGMGGAGKTMLVQELVVRVENKKLFNEVVIAEISQFPNIKRIQHQIADRIGFKNLDKYHSIEAKATHLGDRLRNISRGKKLGDDEEVGQTQGEKANNYDEKGVQGKGKKSGDDEKQDRTEKSGKLLVILDNMWKKLDLFLVGIPYDLEKDLGCKIIVTSRIKDVCTAMDAKDPHIFEVGDLNDDEAEQLFREGVGSMVDNEDYKQASKKLLKKCSRLPLTISVLAGILKNQKLPVWERILGQLEKRAQGETLEVLGNTYSVIEMSYNYIGNKAKKMFFLLCCLFPPGSSVLIDDLLRYGIGLDLFQYVNSIIEAIDQANKWIDELKSVSLLLHIDAKEGEVSIHDDVREAGKSFAAKEKHVFHVGAIPSWLKKDKYKKYTVVSMMSSDNYEYLSGCTLPNLQLLRCLGSCCSKLHENHFSGMTNLKVLDLSESDIETTPSSIKCLKNLDTLLLEHCYLNDISHITELTTLRVLSLKGSNITRLPKGIGALVELKLFDLTDCHQLNKIDAGVFVSLTQLEGLYMKRSFSKWTTGGSMASLSELKSSLRVLEIDIESNKQLPNGDFPTLDLSSYKVDLVESTQNLASFDEISPLDLRVEGVDDASYLIKKGWKSLIDKAESLYLGKIQGLENVAPYLGEYGLKKLKRIKVFQCLGMEYFISCKAAYQSGVFPKLKNLYLEHLPDLVAICPEKAPLDLFSNLQLLSFSYLDGLQSFAIPIQHATKLKVLEVNNCKNLESIFSTRDAMQLCRLPCLQKLILKDLSALRGICVETNANDTNRHVLFKKSIFLSLDKLKLKKLPLIHELWGEEFTTSFPKLRSISLKHMHNLNHVWSSERCKGSFKFLSLKKLKIHDCGSMEIVCPLSVANALDELELLRIYGCEELKQCIFSGKGEDGIISKKMMSFPKLLTLDLSRLENLTYFYQGSMKMEFQVLKSLELELLPNMKTFTRVEHSNKKANLDGEHLKDGVLFDGKVKFHCLEQLHVGGLDNIEELWAVKADKFSTLFPKLKKLTLQTMQKLKHVWSKEFSLTSPSTIYLNKIKINHCNSLESLFPPSATISSLEKVIFPVLKNLTLRCLNKMKTFASKCGDIDNEDGDCPLVPLFNAKMCFSSLEELQLEELPNVEKLWYMTNSQEFNSTFPRLQTLDIKCLHKLRHVWSDELNEETHYFGSLENLTICRCENLECLFSSTMSINSPPQPQSRKVISFPKLQTLQLSDLGSFKCLFWGSSDMEFHTLREMVVDRLPMVKILVSSNKEEDYPVLLKGNVEFFSLEVLRIKHMPALARIYETEEENATSSSSLFPKLKTLHLAGGDDIKLKQLLEGILHKLSSLGIGEIDRLRCLVSSANNVSAEGALSLSKLEKLEELVIKRCDSLENLFEVEGQDVTSLPNLRRLELRELPTLNQIQWHMLPNLRSLQVSGSLEGKRFLIPATSVAKGLSLQSLERLMIDGCPHMEAIIGVEDFKEDCEIVFPQLKEVTLFDLHGLRTFSSASNMTRFPSLISVCIDNCGKLRSFSSGPVATPKLRKLRVDFEPILLKGDLNATLQCHYDSSKKAVKYLPSTLKHKLHEEHELILDIVYFNCCDGCGGRGEGYLFVCNKCKFKLHPTCALEGSQLLEELEKMKVGKDWPKILNHKLLHNHELKLFMGRIYKCDGCGQEGKELFSYYCHECDFDLHPKCAKVCDFDLHPNQNLFPDSQQVGKDWPMTLNDKSHDSHELKHVMGRDDYICDGYDQAGRELFSYYLS